MNEPGKGRSKKVVYVAIFVTAAVLFAIYMSVGPDFGGSSKITLPKRYYTVDDGKTYFADTVDKLPPFTTSDNKTALRAQVMQCEGEAPFVAYVERYTEAEKSRLAGLFKDAKTLGFAITVVMGPEDRPQVKKPSTDDAGWTDLSNPKRFEAITFPRCPKGGTPQIVFPKKGE